MPRTDVNMRAVGSSHFTAHRRRRHRQIAHASARQGKLTHMSQRLLAVVVLGGILCMATEARAEGATGPTGPSTGVAGVTDGDDRGVSPAFSTQVTDGVLSGADSYLQYGVAFVAEATASAGPMCNRTRSTCILGSGGGIIVPRIGWRNNGNWYVGGSYEFTKMDASNLYRLGILQQLRAEARYYLASKVDTQPYIGAAGGVATYGPSWGIDTYGPDIGASLGLEVQIARNAVIGIEVGYHASYFKSFVDSSETSHDGGLAHFVGFSVLLEGRREL
jgi:hypothetical protein